MRKADDRWRMFGCWLGLLFMVAGCQQATAPQSTSPDKPAPPGGAAPIEVGLALNWFPEAEHGGFYAALVHGFFEEEGLKVTIRPGGPGVRVVSDVASGAIEFGVENADKLLVWRAQQADAVAVMSPIQNSPRCIMVHQDSGVSKLQDLATKRPFTLAINSDQPFAQYLQKRINLADVQIVKYQGNVTQFLDAPHVGLQAYSFSEPFVAREHKANPLCLMVSDLGFNTYTSMLIAQREMIDTRPELVAKMTRACIRGWRKYLSEPEATNKYIHEQNPEMGLAVLEFGARELKALCLPEGFATERLGELTAERWQALTKQLEEIGSIKPGAIAAGDAFTTRFLTLDVSKPADATP